MSSRNQEIDILQKKKQIASSRLANNFHNKRQNILTQLCEGQRATNKAANAGGLLAGVDKVAAFIKSSGRLQSRFSAT